MNALRIMAAAGLGISIAATMMLMTLAHPLWRWGTALSMVCFTAAAYIKAVHIGLTALRGKFHVILGSGGLLLSAAIVAGLLDGPSSLVFWLHYLARGVLIISVFMMLIGLIKQGYTLSLTEWGEVLLFYFALAALSLWLFYGLYGGATTSMSILVYLSLFLLIGTLAVVRIYLGSSLGSRWTLGALSVVFITLGDMSMAYQTMSGIAWWGTVQYVGWSMLALIMGIISTLWD